LFVSGPRRFLFIKNFDQSQHYQTELAPLVEPGNSAAAVDTAALLVAVESSAEPVAALRCSDLS
jgi:hypothetical protein